LKALATLGAPVTSIDLTIPEPKQETAPADAASLAKGKEILARAQQAVGGAEKLVAIKDLTQVGEYATDTAGGGIKAKQTNVWLAPQSFRQQSVLPFGTVVAAYDGKTGWIMQGQNRAPMAGAQLKHIQSEAFRVLVPLLLSDRDPDRTVSYAGGNSIEISDKQGNRARVTFDDSGLPLKVSYQLAPMQGAPANVEATYADMKDVDGVKSPFRITLTQDGKKVAEVAVQEYKFNQGIKPEDIEKRP
jgi:hypothetical protein